MQDKQLKNVPGNMRCPHCGTQSAYFRNVRVTGWMKRYFTMGMHSGRELHLTDHEDKVNYKNGVRKYCSECKKEIKDNGK